VNYQFFSFTETASSTVTRLDFHGIDANGSILLDNVSVVASVTTNPATLMVNSTPATADKVGVFRASTGVWYLDQMHASYNPATTLQVGNFGGNGDSAVSGDWLGTGQKYVGVFRPSTGSWYLSTTNTSYTPANTLQIGNFGINSDIAQVGDWLGTGLTEVGVFRPGNGTWYLSTTNTSYAPANTIQIGNFGASGDQPAAGAWA
jgi:hypothetical protein